MSRKLASHKKDSRCKDTFFYLRQCKMTWGRGQEIRCPWESANFGQEKAQIWTCCRIKLEWRRNRKNTGNKTIEPCDGVFKQRARWTGSFIGWFQRPWSLRKGKMARKLETVFKWNIERTISERTPYSPIAEVSDREMQRGSEANKYLAGPWFTPGIRERHLDCSSLRVIVCGMRSRWCTAAVRSSLSGVFAVVLDGQQHFLVAQIALSRTSQWSAVENLGGERMTGS